MDDKARDDIRGSAATALGQIGDRKAVDALSQALLDDKNIVVRKVAAKALGQIGDCKAVETLTQVLLDDAIDKTIHASVIIALSKMQDSSVIQLLFSVFSQTTTTFIRKKILIAFRELRSTEILKFLQPVIETTDYPPGLRLQSLTTYMQIAKKVEPWMREIGKHGDKRLRGKVVEILARYSNDEKDFSWLHTVARFDLDYGCRTEAVRGLARVGKLNTSLLNYLINPNYQHWHKHHSRDTDHGVRGQVGAAVIQNLGTNEPVDTEHLHLVIEMLADKEDTHISVINSALNPLQVMPLDKAKQALETIQSYIPKDADERLLNRLEHHQQLLVYRQQRYQSLAELRYPERFLTHFQAQTQSRIDTLLPQKKILETKMDNEKTTLTADVVLMTAIRNESRAILLLLNEHEIDFSIVSHEERPYWSFNLPQEDGGVLACALAQASTKGAQGSQSLMGAILRDINPKLVVMVGVCGGFEEKGLHLNDVIAAQNIFHYEHERIKEDARYQQPKPYSFTAKFLRWLEALETSFILDKALNGTSLYIKDIAAGNKVLMDKESELRKRILNLSDDIYGIEMEGHGFLHEAWENAASGHVETAMIKAVSDFGDGDKNTDKNARQQAAAKKAASVVLESLRYSKSFFNT